MRKINIILYFIASICTFQTAIFPVFANIASHSDSEEKKYELSICAIYKNESAYLKEWIEYHKMIGVDHFYLYNNGSTDQSHDVLVPYIKEGLVTEVNWPIRRSNHHLNISSFWALSTQIPAYEHAAKYLAANETKWLIFLEIDEFIVPVCSNSIKDILGDFREFPGVFVASDYFNAGKSNELPRRTLLIESLDLTDTPKQEIETCVMKTIFQPEWHDSFKWPPYENRFKENKPAVQSTRNQLRINKYVNRSKNVLNFGKVKDKLHVDSRTLTEQEISLILQNGYEIEDKERVIYKYILEIRKKMGFETEIIR
ncbi:MAG: glycosyltransferase family 92 protein [Verrucomicrobia bacterium]|nr:glycosyltransferase family 92 protein [Verrucomicrobiota bacterium]